MIYRVISYDVGERCSVQDEENGPLSRIVCVFHVVTFFSLLLETSIKWKNEKTKPNQTKPTIQPTNDQPTNQPNKKQNRS